MKEQFFFQCKFLVRDVINIWRRMRPNIQRIKNSNLKNRQVIYLLDIPTYLNLGDQAIGYAEKHFFEKFFPEAEIIEVEGFMVKYYINFINKNIKPQDIVVHIGGGNFGDLYMSIEENRINIIKKLKNHKIVIFPQTIYYTDSDFGKNRLSMMQKAIEENPNILIVAREQVSYEYSKRMFNCNVILIPDIVLFLDKRGNEKRDGILLCMRDDQEKRNDLVSEIKKNLESYRLSYTQTDTIGDKSFTIEERERILFCKWEQFQKSEIVITDRLHGLIFSLITGTPCIVFPNNNFKIRSFYNTWLKNIDYVEYVETLSQMEDKIQILTNLIRGHSCKCDFQQYFQKLAEAIRLL